MPKLVGVGVSLESQTRKEPARPEKAGGMCRQQLETGHYGPESLHTKGRAQVPVKAPCLLCECWRWGLGAAVQ